MHHISRSFLQHFLVPCLSFPFSFCFVLSFFSDYFVYQLIEQITISWVYKYHTYQKSVLETPELETTKATTYRPIKPPLFMTKHV